MRWMGLLVAALLAGGGAAAAAGEVRTVETAARATTAGGEGAAATRRERLRVAVVPVEFSDQARDPRFAPADFERLLFSRGEYVKKSPSGEPVFGSVADFYDENSSGRFRLEGRAFDWVKAPLTKAFYDKVPIWTAQIFLMRAALDRLEAREGKDALAGFDAVNFVIAGERGQHGNLLWPHMSGILWHGRILRYYLTSETEEHRFCAIGVHCHELGHVLGILDKYGSEPHDGMGIWCTMAVGHRGDKVNGDRRPMHLCAWCKMQLGWLDPVTVDPRTAQTIRLRGIERHPAEAVKVLVTPEGDEYFLLENRRRAGFDGGTPSAGLVIWHVGELGASLHTGVWPYNIELVPAHGKVRFGAHKDPERVAWPLPGQDALTPFSWPDSNSWSLRALDVWITKIHTEGEDVVFTLGRPSA